MSAPIETKALTGFRKYDHLQRQGHRNTRGIEEGRVFVFPKVDGTNAAVWSDGETVFAGSRNRQLGLGKEDNAGFNAWVQSDDPKATALRELALSDPGLIFYGEWLVPHTLKTYHPDAWRRFWIFDVFFRREDARGFISYDDYKDLLDDRGLDFIDPLAIYTNPTGAQLKDMTEQNSFLITEGQGFGEGVVCKNYEWRNSAPEGWDRVWGKFVRSEFKSAHVRAMGPPERTGKTEVERVIAEQFVTSTLVGKNVSKVLLEVFNELDETQQAEANEYAEADGPSIDDYLIDNHRGRIIPRVLGRIWNDLIEEEMWNILKKHKGATIDFARLQALVTLKIKLIAEKLF